MGGSCLHRHTPPPAQATCCKAGLLSGKSGRRLLKDDGGTAEAAADTRARVGLVTPRTQPPQGKGMAKGGGGGREKKWQMSHLKAALTGVHSSGHSRATPRRGKGGGRKEWPWQGVWAPNINVYAMCSLQPCSGSKCLFLQRPIFLRPACPPKFERHTPNRATKAIELVEARVIESATRANSAAP